MINNPYRGASIVFLFLILAGIIVASIQFSNIGAPLQTADSLPSNVSGSPRSNTKVLMGRVFPSSDYGYVEGSHVLLDNQGDVTAILKSNDDKLLLVIGMEVEVEGKVKVSSESDLEIMDVATISIK